MLLYLILMVAIIICDQLVKAWTVAHLTFGGLQVVVPNVLGLTYVQNDGAAWSLLAGQTWFFYIITVLAVGVMGYLFYQTTPQERLYRIGLTCMLAGALGNFIDRLHLKYVVDMFELQFINFPIFNVADLALTVGVICVGIAILLKEKSDS